MLKNTRLMTLAGAFLLCLTPLARAADVGAAFNKSGLAGLTLDNQDRLAVGTPAISRILAGTTALAHKPSSSTFDEASRTLTQTYPWGTVTIQYTPEPQGLKTALTIKNTGDAAITELTLQLLQLKPFGPTQRLSPGANGTAGPVIAHGSGADLVAAVVGDLGGKPANVGFGPIPAGNKQTPTATALRITLGGEAVLLDNLTAERPIAPGASDTLSVSLRLAKPGTSIVDLTRDTLDAYAKANPALLNWPDRRPIFRYFLGGGAPMEQALENLQNPDKLTPPAPDEKFHKAFLARMANTVKAAKAADAQGVIIWDPEGGAFPHPVTYIGDPRLIAALNPQLDLVIDDGMKLLRDAGLKVGICIRPTLVTANAAKKTATHNHTAAKDPYTQLEAKVEYAQKRWGATLFYIDTNFFWRPYGDAKVWKSGQLPPDIYRRLQQKFPDCLFIPEFGNVGDYAASAPYGEADMGAWGTSNIIRAIWPDAFRVIVIEDADPYENFNRFVTAVRQRNALMTFGQAPGTGNVVAIARIYQEARLLDAGAPDIVKKTGVGQLSALLTAPELATRFYAARQLVDTPEPAAGAALLAGLTSDTEEWIVKRQLAAAFHGVPHEPAIPVLLDLVASTSKKLHVEAARGLAKQGPVASKQLLTRIDKEVMNEKIARGSQPLLEQLTLAVASMRDSTQAAPLESLYALVPDSKFAYLAKDALLEMIGATGHAPAETFLSSQLENDATRVAAARGLLRLRTDSATKRVESLLESAQKRSDKLLVDSLTAALKQLAESEK